jgi:signal transduction histidine kinase/ligand-binding sensor domain-containing protein
MSVFFNRLDGERLWYKAYIVILFTCSLFSIQVRAQKYTFTHYDIEDGLIQSQVNKLSQDATHALWMGTLGGACRFDGRDFTSYSKENGLSSNFIYNVLCDKKNRTWIGSQYGIACIVNKKAINYPIPKNVRSTWVTDICEDGAGTVWLVMDHLLFKITDDTLQYMPVKGAEGCSVMHLAVNVSGHLYVSVFSKGIYCLNGNGWENIAPQTDQFKNIVFKKLLFDRFDHDRLYLLAENGLYQVSDHHIINFPNAELNKFKGLISLSQDNKGGLWIGTSNGALYFNNDRLIHFNAQNGFTDVGVPDVFCDKDNNIWLATWGAGLYKYEGDAYVLFDRAAGLTNFQGIMGLARSRTNKLLLGTDGSGLLEYDGKTFKDAGLGGIKPNLRKIQTLYTDKESNVWIGTSLEGLWKFDGKTYLQIPQTQYRVINSIVRTDDGTVWFAAPMGCFYYDGHDVKHLNGLYTFSSALLPLPGDSLLIGTQLGVRLAVNKTLVAGFSLPAVTNSTIFCMLSYHNLVLIGTADRGLFIWDRKTGAIKNYNTNNGFNSNSIYNLVTDNNNTVWAGTGHGVNRIIINSHNLGCTILEGGNAVNMVAEANQNSVINVGGKVWMGTTKGLIAYNTNVREPLVSKPYVMIQSVMLIKPQGSYSSSAMSKKNIELTNGARIPYEQNHLSISVFGVYLKNPKSVSYQYQLIGFDDKFCEPVKNPWVDYPSLPPGKYTFRVKAVVRGGISSDNIAQFSFEITPLFYQTWYFKVLFLLLFLALGIALQTYMHKRKLKAVKLIERMKREEKNKIRQQTAEDFHDDLGNKLTRITVLSDILTTKLDSERDDEKKLVRQIKQNAEALYTGTRDILWALDPQSDNLYEILVHVKQFGTELFMDTDIEFAFQRITPELNDIKLPMEYSRNVTMIYKELLNNVLKHAFATKVTFTWEMISNQKIEIVLTDNGKGFDMQNTGNGYGIKNIKNRATRLMGNIVITSTGGVGTKAILKLELKNN